MFEMIEKINSVVNNFVWGVPAMVCIIGVGLYLSFRTRFIQIRKLGYSFKETIGKIFHKKEASAGSITPFQAVCTALAATVGTGNIAGVAGAIALGGPGAVFWMWISAFLGMCTKYGRSFPREKQRWGLGRRTDVLYQERAGEALEMAGGCICRAGDPDSVRHGERHAGEHHCDSD